MEKGVESGFVLQLVREAAGGDAMTNLDEIVFILPRCPHQFNGWCFECVERIAKDAKEAGKRLGREEAAKIVQSALGL